MKFLKKLLFWREGPMVLALIALGVEAVGQAIKYYHGLPTSWKDFGTNFFVLVICATFYLATRRLDRNTK
jgi:hypothetical protein